MTPNISQTAKQTTNAHVVTPSTMMLLRFDMLPRCSPITEDGLFAMGIV
jgi:hypothetical protein